MGNDLIDPQSLPQWMAGQETPAPLSGQKGLSASTLFDEEALPPWLRNASQEPQHGNDKAFPAAPQAAQAAPFTPSAQPIPPVPPAYSQQNQAPAMPGFNNSTPQPQVNGNLPASSSIDMNAAPGWLKPAGEQAPHGNFGQQQQGAPGMSRQASFGVPARPENARVPSRPRAEKGPYEESEVAANVFASMLGVASPNLPGQQRGQAPGPMQPAVQQPIPQQPQQQWANAGDMHGQAMPAQSMPGGYGGPHNPPNQQGQSMNQGYAPGNVAGNMSSQQARPMNVTGMQPGGAAMQVDDSQAKANTRPARRGFLSTILEWFSFSR